MIINPKILFLFLVLIHFGCQDYSKEKEFPIILQENPIESGPICLKMISQHYGKNVSMAELETLTKMDDDGTSLLDLTTAADSIGFETLAVKISFDELIEAPLPAIVVWKDNYFIVIYKIGIDTILVADPSLGKIQYSNNQFCQGWVNSEDRTLSDGITILIKSKE